MRVSPNNKPSPMVKVGELRMVYGILMSGPSPQLWDFEHDFTINWQIDNFTMLNHSEIES